MTVPVQNLSVTMDHGLLLRAVELASSVRRMVSILKERQTEFDATIREFLIDSQGITVGGSFEASALLTGAALPASEG